MSESDEYVLTFTVPGVPVAQARKRVRVLPGGGVHHYETTKCESYKSLVRDAYRQAAGCHLPREGPVRLLIRTFWPIPKSMRKRDKALAEIELLPYIGKRRNDWDNLGKIVSDALNQIAWVDDGQICTGMVTKHYSPRPRMEIQIAFDGSTE